MKNSIGLKELRENVEDYILQVEQGESFTVYRRSTPVFKITPVEDEHLEEVVDFTKLRKGGVNIDELLGRL